MHVVISCLKNNLLRCFSYVSRQDWVSVKSGGWDVAMKPVQGIDHLLVAVRDLDGARAAYERLGFHTTPRGDHRELGSANHCVVFQSDYIELLSVGGPHPVTEPYARQLERREGVGAIALRTDDAAAAVPGLRAAGLKPAEPVSFARPVDLPEGRRDARFRITGLDPAATPGARMFLCQHLTPELVWRPEYRKHPNGAVELTRVLIVADDPGLVAAKLAAVFAGRPSGGPDEAEVATGSTPIVVMRPARFRAAFPEAALVESELPYVAGFGVAVCSEDDLRHWAHAHGVALPHAADGTPYVPPSAACGTVIAFSFAG